MGADLLIIGAGAAGFGAWRECHARGLAAIWVEAKDRTGGRAWIDATTLSVPFDLGCHWLQSADVNPFRRYADDLGVAYATDPIRFGFHDGARFLDSARCDEGSAAFERLYAGLCHAYVEGRGGSVLDALGDVDEPVWRGYFAQWLHHECAANPADASITDSSLLAVSAEDYPVPSGFGALIRRLTPEGAATLDCAVRRIDLSRRDRIVAETSKGAIEARGAVLTVSTGVLAAEAIAMAPGGWPLDKLRAIEATPLGSSSKIALEIPPAALPPELRGRFTICAMTAPQNIEWHFAPHGGDCAVAYLGGPFSRELAMAGEAAQIQAAREHLTALLGSGIRSRIGRGRATPFDRDPYLGGGYSYCRAEIGSLRAALAEPIDGRLFFAGEACSARFAATAHGAYLSGREAVRRFHGGEPDDRSAA